MLMLVLFRLASVALPACLSGWLPASKLAIGPAFNVWWDGRTWRSLRQESRGELCGCVSHPPAKIED